MERNIYKAFGLNIASDFKLPELVEGEGTCSVEIELLKGVVDEISDDFLNDIVVKTNQNEIIYQLKNIARCKILEGKTVFIQPAPSVSHSALRLMILTSVFGCILIQKRKLPIHGSSVVIGSKCLIIMGESGAGKSTLTSTFLKKGYKFLSDDVSVVSVNESGDIYVQPGYPYRKLHQDSAKYHSIDYIDYEKVEFEEDKYLIPQHDYFMNEPVALSAFIEIVQEDTDAVSITRVKGISKLDVLMRNLYRGILTSFFNSKAFYFTQIGDMASKVDIYRVIRPKGKFSCNDQIELILKELEK